VSTALVALLSGLGLVHLVAYYAGWRVVAGVVKSVPVLLLAGIVASRGTSAAALVAAGLVFSAVGDVSLVSPRGFLAGLSAFFAAHCCYVAAFAPGVVASGTSVLAAVAIGGVAAAMLRHLWPHVGGLRGPVVVYAGVLALMAWCAVARALASPTTAAEAGAIGALSFLVSDGVLAHDRFARRFRAAHAVVMVTYYAAQILIARSTL
jgi:uncharacterized membrane protein YhhN